MIFETLLFNLFLIIGVHWVSDFVLQTDAMARGKSTSIKWLSIHVAVYTVLLFIFGWQFALINGAVHWVVDFFTSKWSSYLWKKEEVHWFFVVIGLDQAIHMATLLSTFFWMFV